MRIKNLLIENFRSIGSVELKDLPDVVVFYGENGTGKSNILRAIQLFWTLLGELMAYGLPAGPLPTSSCTNADFPDRSAELEMRICATIDFAAPQKVIERLVTSWEISLVIRRQSTGFSVEAERQGFRSSIEWSQADLAKARGPLLAGFYAKVQRALLSIPDIRGARPTSPEHPPSPPPRRSLDVVQLALDGRLPEAALAAQVSEDPELQTRLTRLNALMRRAPLYRPAFRPYEDADGRAALQEVHERDGRKVGIPLSLEGLGVQQIYAILGAIVLSGAPIVTLEEPEAHLHALTTGRALRSLLLGLTAPTAAEGEARVEQLFVATHSELFDLNPREYFEVSVDSERRTMVERRTDLVNIDLRHTYMPGAARHALMDVLSVGPGDRVVFLRADGTGVTADEMVTMLQEDAEEAIAYLESLTRSAVRAVAGLARAGIRAS